LTDFFRRIFDRFRRRPDDFIVAAERLLGHRFHDRSLLKLALTHRSYIPISGSDHHEANEVLEFLGDAGLEMIVVEYLFRRFPDKREGELSKMKSMLVCGSSLHHIAREINFGSLILMSGNEARNGGRMRGSILEDAMEAVVAALYLDGGIKPAKRFIERYILPRIDDPLARQIEINFKSLLLEYSQARGMGAPVYTTLREEGPDHAKQFEVEVLVGNKPMGRGNGTSKKAAQQKAASAAIAAFKSTDLTTASPQVLGG